MAQCIIIMSPSGNSIGWEPRLMKRRSLVCQNIYIIIIESNNSMVLSPMYLNYNDNALMPI
jgi:hypothetical protein